VKSTIFALTVLFNHFAFATDSAELERIFTYVYDKNFWADSESRSGGGSTLAATTMVREQLPALLEKLNVRTMLDAPCGDFNWMSQTNLSSVQYIGLDIVSEMVRANQSRYGNPIRKFMQGDIVHDTLPEADLIFCRWCLPHLSHQDVMRAVTNFKKSKAKYLLTTTYPALKKNSEIMSGGVPRFVNLQIAPFNFPQPLLLITDQFHPEAAAGDDCLGLWLIDDLPNYEANISQSQPVDSRLESVYTQIYNINFWSSPESRSGPGSTLASTEVIRRQLPLLLKKLEVKTLLDAPCGDFNWMEKTELGDVQYIGADIVKEMIVQNEKKYSHPNRSFLCRDISCAMLPQSDLVLCRWCLPHLSFDDAKRVIRNFKRSGAKYLLITTFPAVGYNQPIVTGGGHRYINLQKAPYNFPAPMGLLIDAHHSGGAEGHDYLGLWRLEDLPDYD
jgi:hypothetical protein